LLSTSSTSSTSSTFSTFPLCSRLTVLDTTLHLSRRAALLKPTAVNSILADIRQVQARGRTVISLMRGEPDLETPAHIVDAAAAAMSGPHAVSGQSR